MKATLGRTLRTLQVTVQELGGMAVCMSRHEEQITHLIVGSKCSTSNARTFKVPLYLPSPDSWEVVVSTKSCWQTVLISCKSCNILPSACT